MATDALTARLREANEDDVEAALAGSHVEETCANVDRVALLEFFNRMLDRLVGEDE